MLNVVFSNPVVSCFVVAESVIYYANTVRLKRVTFYYAGFKTRYIAYRYICGKKRPNVFNSDEGYFHLANLDSLFRLSFHCQGEKK
jgi:hypothetical protein